MNEEKKPLRYHIKNAMKAGVCAGGWFTALIGSLTTCTLSWFILPFMEDDKMAHALFYTTGPFALAIGIFTIILSCLIFRMKGETVPPEIITAMQTIMFVEGIVVMLSLIFLSYVIYTWYVYLF